MADKNDYELNGVSNDKTARFSSEEHGSPDVLSASENSDLPEELKQGFTHNDQRDMHRMGKKQEFRVRNNLVNK